MYRAAHAPRAGHSVRPPAPAANGADARWHIARGDHVNTGPAVGGRGFGRTSLSTLSSRHARRVTRRHGRVSAHRSRQWWCRCLRRCVRLRSQYDRRKVPVRSHANFFVDIRVTFATSVPRLGCHHKFRCRANRHALFINPALISFMKRAGARQTVASPALCSWGKAARAFR